MRNLLKATFSGFVLGIAVFLLSGWSVYFALWHISGSDLIPPDSTPAAGLAVVGALGWGLIIGTVLGLISWLLFAIYLYRRYAPRVATR
jgi:hypothetical protein